MRARQAVKARKLFVVSGFLHDNAERLPRTCGGPLLREFDDVLAELRASVVDQEALRRNAMSETQTYHALRKDLILQHMKPIAVAAYVRIGNCEESTPFKVPRHNLPSALLFGAAHGMAHVAEEHKDIFVGAGLPPDFADRLREAAWATQAAWDRRSRARGSKSGSTVGIDDALRRASGLVELLSVFVRQDAGDNTALFAEWSTLALKRAPRRLRGASTKALVSPQPATAPATARLLGTGTSEPSTAAASRPGLFGTITRMLRLPAPSDARG